MPLFRFHRGGLHDSLATTVIVRDINHLKSIIAASLDDFISKKLDFKIKVEAYPSKESCFDKRIGWFTQIVTSNILEKDKFHVEGFLSEPFKD